MHIKNTIRVYIALHVRKAERFLAPLALNIYSLFKIATSQHHSKIVFG